jgi:hypothetical protein
MKSHQRGLSFIGNVVVLAILVVLAYYAFQIFTGTDSGPGCKDALTSCMKYCRRTTTDAPSAQSCQDACQRDAEACARAAR